MGVVVAGCSRGGWGVRRGLQRVRPGEGFTTLQEGGVGAFHGSSVPTTVASFERGCWRGGRRERASQHCKRVGWGRFSGSSVLTTMTAPIEVAGEGEAIEPPDLILVQPFFRVN